MTVDEAITIINSKAAGRTRYAGQEPYLDEVLVAEIERLRAQLLNWVPLPQDMSGWGEPDAPDETIALIREACEVHAVETFLLAQERKTDDQ